MNEENTHELLDTLEAINENIFLLSEKLDTINKTLEEMDATIFKGFREVR